MPAWEVRGRTKGAVTSWRDLPDYAPLVKEILERVEAPKGRGIPWEGAEVWVFKYRPSSLRSLLEQTLEAFPDNEAFVLGKERLTWRQWGQLVHNAAMSLIEDFGVQKGDRISLLTGSCIEFTIAYWAAIEIGAIVVPHNYELAPEGILYQINRVEPSVVVVSQKIWQRKVKPIQGKLVSGVRFVVSDNGATSEGITPFSKLLAKSKEFSLQTLPELDEWDEASIIFTSGTTGVPKASILMHTNIIHNALHAGMLMTSDDVVLIMVPLFHVTSLHSQIAPAVMRGAKSVLMGYFHPTEALQLIQHEKVTFLSGAPVMLWLMMVQPDFDAYDVSSLQKVGYGGSAASPQFVKMVAEKFPNASQINAGGMTEHTSLGFALPPEDALRKRGSVGLSLVTSEITLFDEEGYEILEPGKLGEIAFKGPLTSKGYWRDPEKTKETFRRDGYVLSGDIGKIDEEGYLWIADRKKDMISRGGQKCYGVELENVLFGLNKVLDVAIVGVPDRVFTERVKAVITPKPGEELTKAEVLAFCEQHLAKYEIPEYVVFKKDLLPKNPGGKTIKTLLIDDWGDLPDHAKDPAIERYKGFLSSLHPKLESVPLLFVGDREMTAGEGLSHMEHADAIGEKIRDIVQQEGIVALLR